MQHYGSVDSSTKAYLKVNYAFTKGQTLVVTGYIGSTILTKQLTVGDKAYVSTVSVKGLYNSADATSKTINTDSTFGNYQLLLDAKDQYGNSVTAGQLITDLSCQLQPILLLLI